MDQEHIGKFIKEIRQNNHQTQKEFADKYNVSFQAVSKWENGKNIPDISLLKQICKDNNISIDEILGDKPKTINIKKKIIILISVIILLLIILISVLILYSNKDSNFEFKKVSTSCSNFKITGSAAYNNDKSSIYISNVEFCGENEDIKYKEVKYTLFDGHDDVNIKISSGNIEKDITLIEYLKNLKINVNDYSHTCKSFQNSELYIEISATDDNDEITIYKIPLFLEENCE